MGDFDFTLALPVICVVSYALLTLLLAPAFRRHGRMLALPAVVGLGMSGWIVLRLWGRAFAAGPQETAHGLIRIDGFGLFFSFVVLVVGALSLLASAGLFDRDGVDVPEFYPLMLFCIAGLLIMVQTTHLLMVLIGLELFSLSLNVLRGLDRSRPRAVEAAMKYFVLGAFASGFVVCEGALLYAAAGALDMFAIRKLAMEAPGPLLIAGMALVLVGLLFKIAAVPFHQWVPDAYEGAMTNVTAFVAAVTTTTAFAVLLRILIGVFGAQSAWWMPVMTALAILTMTVANLVALAQDDLRRMLAFSSIAHAGYLLIAFVCEPELAVPAVMVYLAVYGFMTVGAFTALAIVGRREDGYRLADWAGLGRRRPALGLAMAVFLVSLAGIPPTGGFIGKYVIFQAALDSGRYVLAGIGVVNAAIAAYYYLRIIVTMYLREPETDSAAPSPPSLMAATVVTLAVAAVLYLGLAPSRILALIHSLTDALI